jgi:hypothetical protein
MLFRRILNARVGAICGLLKMRRTSVSKCPGFLSLSLDLAVCIGDVLTFYNVAMCVTVPFSRTNLGILEA